MEQPLLHHEGMDHRLQHRDQIGRTAEADVPGLREDIDAIDGPAYSADHANGVVGGDCRGAGERQRDGERRVQTESEGRADGVRQHETGRRAEQF